MAPTSATGSLQARRGFTLVEVMVAVAIMGLAAGFILLAAPGREPNLTTEAARLGARLLHARDEAVLTNRTFEVRLSPAGYDFDVVTAGRRDAVKDGPFQAMGWVEGTMIEAAPARIAFDPTGGAQPVQVVLSRGPARMAVSVDAAGNVRVHAPGL